MEKSILVKDLLNKKTEKNLTLSPVVKFDLTGDGRVKRAFLQFRKFGEAKVERKKYINI